MFTQHLFTSRKNNEDGSNIVGQEGRMWYDSTTNTIRIGNGTLGGQIISGGGGSGTGSALTITDNGTVLASNTTQINFVGLTVTSPSTNVITVTAASGPSAIYDGGNAFNTSGVGAIFDAGGAT